MGSSPVAVLIMILSSKSKRVYNSKLKPLYIAFLNSMKLSGSKMGIKSDKNLLALEQSSYASKIVNVDIVYDLDAWSIDTTNNFKFKKSLFGAIRVVN